MVRLNRRDMQLAITQGYKLSEDLFSDLLNEASGIEIDLDKKKLSSTIRSLSRNKSNTNIDTFALERLLLDLKDINKQSEAILNFKYKDKKVSNLFLDFEDYHDSLPKYCLCDFINLDNILEDIICFDFTRLLDWMAYEIGHQTFDEDLTIKYFDNLFGNKGLLYPADMDALNNVIPENFEQEILDLCVDTTVDSQYYVKTTKRAYDYFMQDIQEKRRKNNNYLYFKPLLNRQSDYLSCIMLFYLMVRANSSVIDFKLLEVQHGKIYFILGENKFNKESFKEHLTDTIHINLLDRKFEYKPKVSILHTKGLL